MNATERLAQGRAAFNRGEFFAAHERWEDAWHQLAGPARELVQGLIQIAAALHHVQQGRPRPAASLLAKGLDKLSRPVPPTLADLPIASFAGEVARFLAELTASPTGMPDPTRLEL